MGAQVKPRPITAVYRWMKAAAFTLPVDEGGGLYAPGGLLPGGGSPGPIGLGIPR